MSAESRGVLNGEFVIGKHPYFGSWGQVNLKEMSVRDKSKIGGAWVA